MMITTRRGFTVVELVVVIAIIGLLIALVPPAGKPSNDNARVTWLVYLLPFVESAALFDSLVLVPPVGLGWESMTMNYPPNGPGGRTTSGATATSPPAAGTPAAATA